MLRKPNKYLRLLIFLAFIFSFVFYSGLEISSQGILVRPLQSKSETNTYQSNSSITSEVSVSSDSASPFEVLVNIVVFFVLILVVFNFIRGSRTKRTYSRNEYSSYKSLDDDDHSALPKTKNICMKCFTPYEPGDIFCSEC